MKNLSQFIIEAMQSDFFDSVQEKMIKNGDGIYVVYYSGISADRPFIYAVKNGKVDFSEDAAKDIHSTSSKHHYELAGFDKIEYWHCPGLKAALETLKKTYKDNQTYLCDKMWSMFADKPKAISDLEKMKNEFGIDEILKV